MHVIRIGAGFVIAIVFAILLVRNVDIHEVARATGLFGLQVVAFSVGLVLAAYSLRAQRWQFLLKGAGVSANYREAVSIFFASFALNNVVPLRAGDVYRCVTASRMPEGTIAKALATLLTERLLDLAALTVLLGVLLVIFPKMLGLVSSPIAVVSVVALLILVALIGFPAQARSMVDALLIGGLSRVHIMTKAATFIGALTVAVEGTLSGRWRFRVIGLTVLAWAIELGVFAVIASALSGEILLSGGFFAGVLGTLATLIPSAPGHWGTFDFFAAEGFRYSGFDAEQAVAAAIVCHLIIIVPVTLIGSFHLVTSRQASPDVS